MDSKLENFFKASKEDKARTIESTLAEIEACELELFEIATDNLISEKEISEMQDKCKVSILNESLPDGKPKFKNEFEREQEIKKRIGKQVELIEKAIQDRKFKSNTMNANVRYCKGLVNIMEKFL